MTGRFRQRATLLAIPFFLLGLAFSSYQYSAAGDLPEDLLAREIETLLDRIADRPDDAALRIRLARLYEQHDQLDDAIGLLKDGVVRPDLSRRGRYDLYVELARLYLEADDPKNAYRTASLARKLQPSRAVAYNRRGQSHEATGRRREAVQEYKRAESVEPTDPESYHRRASIHEKNGRADLAEGLLREAIARAPGSAQALVNLAEFLIRQGRIAEALELLEKAVALAPRDARVRVARARAFVRSGQEDRALEEYAQATRLNPRVSVAAEEAGDIYFKREDYQNAVDRYEKALQYDRKNRSLVRKYRRARRLLSPSKKETEDAKSGGRTGPGGEEADPTGPGRGPSSANNTDEPVDPGLEPSGKSGRESQDSEDVARLKALGRQKYAARNYAEARDLFARAAVLAPKDDESHYLLGRAQLQLGESAAGTRSLETALELNPKNGAAAFHLGTHEYNSGNFARAVKRFEAAAAHSPALRDQATFNQARGLEKSGNNQAALAAYERAAASEKWGPSAAMNHAILCRRLRQYQRAERVLAAATARHPNDADLWFQRGSIEEARGRSGPARSSYAKAISLRPDHAAAWFNQGLLAARAGQYAQARTALQKASDLLPSDPAAPYELGRTLLRQGNTSEAVRALTEALRREGGHPGATILLAPIHLDQGRPSEALRLIDASRSRHKDNYDLAFNAGNLLRRMDQREKSRLAYRDAIRLEPGRPDAYMNLALSYRDTKEFERAARVYEALLQRLPDHAPAHEQLGLLYYRELGRRSDGARHIRRFLSLQPSAPNAAQLRRLLEP